MNGIWRHSGTLTNRQSWGRWKKHRVGTRYFYVSICGKTIPLQPGVSQPALLLLHSNPWVILRVHFHAFAVGLWPRVGICFYFCSLRLCLSPALPPPSQPLTSLLIPETFGLQGEVRTFCPLSKRRLASYLRNVCTAGGEAKIRSENGQFCNPKSNQT